MKFTLYLYYNITILLNISSPRTTWTEHQKKVLEDFYRNETKKPSEEQKDQLGQQLGKDTHVINVRTNILLQCLNL